MSDRLSFYFREKVTEEELNLGFTLAENADLAMMVDHALPGVVQGCAVTQRGGGANLSVDVAAGTIYTKDGQRITFGVTQNVPVSLDENNVSTTVTGGGHSRIISVFAKFTRALSDPRLDGNSATVYFNEAESFTFVVRQGVEGVSPTPVALDSSMILLADVTRVFGDTSILNSAIATSGASARREDVFQAFGSTYSTRRGRIKDVVTDVYTAMNAERSGEAGRIAAMLAGGPTITGAAISGGTITSSAISGGTISGAAITTGTIAGASVGSGTITALGLVTPTLSGVPVITAVEIDSTGDSYVKTKSYIVDMQTTTTGAVDAFTWTIDDTATTKCLVEAVAIKDDATVGADFTKKRRFRRNTTVTAGSETLLDSDIEAGIAAAALTVTNSGTTGQVQVTGIAATNLRWGLKITLTIIKYNTW